MKLLANNKKAFHDYFIEEKYEAGTQNFFGAIAMAKALSDLKNIGFQNIEMHEKLLKDYIINSMKSIKNVIPI